ncbi:Ppx/GppA phosphatase family protein [cf. Phormidesmis sp. LEGE 11477]|uniref:Ppx/GppA phosphatase family protein n=1 Tax=cf. Phormidesmis sp. LEGE 11477 TaxID=1828680 RepID=UPI0018810A48|nr:Ppx/GppA phosphatase family protein [cf. Phormidesmis sp. LEGE 11477]MBE9063632.1 Ppx/GppA family phosphatase [cf. Phormidesmis sp. LEGE 11477]
MINTAEAKLSERDVQIQRDSDEHLSLGGIESAFNLTSRERLLSSGRSELVLVAIDIGTNSIHMVIVKIDATLPAFNIIGKEKDTVRLGDFCEETDSLTEEAMTRAVASLKRCLQIAESFQADDVVAVATSAVREAANGQVFIDRVKAEVGLSINLIAGKEEARRIYLGVISGMELKGKPHVIVDIGGGSTEIIAGRGGRHDFLSSSKVGAVRLTSQFVSTDPISKEEYNYLRAYVRGVLEPTIDSLKAKLKKKLAGTEHEQTPLRMIGTSGTIECLATLAAIDKTGAEPDPINGCLLTRDQLDARINQLRKMSYKERLALPGMSERRAEIVVPGAIILQTVMQLLNISQLKVCERALREGVVVNWMLINGLIEDRMAFQDSIRDRSIRKLANKYKANGDIVAQFATSLFDQTQGVLHNLSPLGREYLWAAAMLHNSGHYISHSAHHKHSYYLIRNGGLLGFTETEIEIIGNIARYHRKNLPKRRHDNYNNLPGKYERKLVDQLGAILRVAVALDRARSHAIAAIETTFDPKSRTLTLQLIPFDKNNQCELELWNIDYKKAWFEDVFEVSLEATVAVASD